MRDSGSDRGARPPWQAVSVSTLPKPDKNALLRARLLDATRRLRASKSTVGSQADMMPTKLLKEVSLGAQLDLLLPKEVGTLTDGCYMKRADGSGKYMLTFSVSQMTDEVAVADASTQTLLPRVPGDAFMKAYLRSCRWGNRNSNQCSDVQEKLLHNLWEIRKSTAFPYAPYRGSDDEVDERETFADSKTDTNSTANATVEPLGCGSPSKNLNRPSLLKPTCSSWHFEYEEMENDCKFKPYTINPSGRRTSCGSTFSPRHQCKNWEVLLVAIDELIRESNHLVDIVEDASFRNMRRHVSSGEKCSSVAPLRSQQDSFPSDYWLPIINQQEKELAELKKCARGTKLTQLEKYLESQSCNDPIL